VMAEDALGGGGATDVAKADKENSSGHGGGSLTYRLSPLGITSSSTLAPPLHKGPSTCLP
jgi:hypothetical protein